MKDKTLECEYCLLPLTPPEAYKCEICGAVHFNDCVGELSREANKSLALHIPQCSL